MNPQKVNCYLKSTVELTIALRRSYLSSAMEGAFVPLQHSYSEGLTPNVMICGSTAFGR